MAFDISILLKPVLVKSSFLGTVEVDARKQTFYDWFRQGRAQKRWTDPHAFVRAFLAEQTRLRSTGEPPAAPQIDALTPRRLNAFAKAFIKAAGKLIAPRLIKDAAGQRLRARRGGEDYPVASQAAENESGRLLSLLTDSDDEQRAQARQRTDDMRKMLEGPRDLLRRIDPFGDQINNLRRGILGPSLYGQLTSLHDGLSARSSLEAEARSTAQAISREIGRVALGRNLHTSAIGQYGMIASQLADQQSAISRARDTLGFVGAFGTADKFLQEEMARRRAWGESVRQFLNPSLSSGLLASMIGGRRNMAVGDAIEAAAGLSRGFMTAANLGLAGVSARGATAEVLSQYRADASRHSDLFRDVMSAIQLVDADELVDEELAEGLSTAQRSARRIDLTNPVQVAVLLALISLLVSVYVAVLQREALELARSSATSTDVRAVQTEMRALRNDLRRAREEERLEWRDIRYVVDATPLRAEPERGSLVLLTVYPDQLLRVLAARGAWARVEVISYNSGAAQSGWIARRRLRARPE